MKGLFKKINESKVFKDLSEQEFAWVLYDVGNSAFTMLGCSLIPIWFKSLAIGDAPGQISGDNATAYWALATSLVTVVVALIGPVCGAIADHKDTKKAVFTTSVAIGVIGCVINGFASSWMLFLIIYILAKIAYQASLTFYDSMLNDVTTDDRADAVSAYGYAWGYIGSCIPFTVALIAYVMGPDMLGIISGTISRMIGFIVTAAWWWIVTVPLLGSYKQINYSSDEKGAISKEFKKIFATLKRIASRDKKVLYFLIAFFLYIDGVGTIIDNCINIGTDLGLNTVGQVIFLLLTQVVAWIGSLVFAKLSKKKDTVALIQICILGYTAVCLYALTLTKLWQFAVMAFGVGCFQGSIQSLSRSYYSKIIPDENSGEYFGIYDIFAKGASFLGSFLIYVVKKIGIRTGGVFNIFGAEIKSINVAIGLLAFFFIIGLFYVRAADKQPQSEESKPDIQ
ncbi:MAG: MFS transporter [Erysipelotrichaceae bacterium]|nr:MFS transporter [Erysipelotrichaceae bacterium]